MTTTTEIFEREARHLCERQNIAYHDWQRSERVSDIIFVRGVQSNGEKVEVWAIEFRPKLHMGPLPETNPNTDMPIEVMRASCVLVAGVGFDLPDLIVEETYAYNTWEREGANYQRNRDNGDYFG